MPNRPNSTAEQRSQWARKTPTRAFRVDDKTWARVQLIAKNQKMTVAEIIVNYLRTLKIHEPIQKKRTVPKHTRGQALRIHNVRVDDELWNMLGQVAERNGMTRTDIIVDYLRTLVVPSDQKPGGRQKLAKIRTDIKVPKPSRPNPPARKPVDKETCEHLIKKTMGDLGTFCADCGIKVAP